MKDLENTIIIEEVFPIYVELYFSKSKKAYEFWNKLSSINDCYIFGGFIVDYLNKKNEHRDIDIVIDFLNRESIELIHQFEGVKNSFGGYKIKIENIVIDLWAITDTWAIKKMNYLNFDLLSILPSTSFFNSTAIIYSIQNKKLIHNKKFLQFFNEKIIDILFEDNPIPELCIIKSYEYYIHGFNLTNHLKEYINRKFFQSYNQFEKIQIKHYGEIKFEMSELELFNKYLIDDLNKNKKYSKPKFIVPSEQLLLFS
jgi:hypothetical protein